MMMLEGEEIGYRFVFWEGRKKMHNFKIEVGWKTNSYKS